MQLDDVGELALSRSISADVNILKVSSLTTGPRVGEAMERSVRWLDRCIAQHERSGKKEMQNLFAIVQGGLDPELRDRCLEEMVKRKDGVAGFAIGGLSGGEEKGLFILNIIAPHANSSNRFRCFLANVGAVLLFLPVVNGKFSQY